MQVFPQVVVSGLNLQFQSNKLSRTIEDAKQTAASYVMSQIGCPLEGGECLFQIIYVFIVSGIVSFQYKAYR